MWYSNEMLVAGYGRQGIKLESTYVAATVLNNRENRSIELCCASYLTLIRLVTMMHTLILRLCLLTILTTAAIEGCS